MAFIGVVIDPVTKEESGIDTELLGNFIMTSSTIDLVGKKDSTTVNYKFIYNEKEKDFKVEASIANNENIKGYSSIDPSKVSLFIIDAINNNTGSFIDYCDDVNNAKKEAFKDLTSHLLENNEIVKDSYFNGYGFLFIDGKRILTIEKLQTLNNDSKEIKNASTDEEITKQYNNYFRISNCCGLIDISKTDLSKTINFYYNNKIFTIKNITIIDGNNDKIKSYTIGADNIEIVDMDNKNLLDEFSELKDISNQNIDSDELDNRIKQRIELLDNFVTEEEQIKDIEEEFDDIF